MAQLDLCTLVEKGKKLAVDLQLDVVDLLEHGVVGGLLGAELFYYRCQLL